MGQIILQEHLSDYKYRYRNKKIAAVCGCFDIFHIGHLEHLISAKNLCDILFVGVNTAESVILNKNKSPVFDDSQRIRIIKAIECVDYVFLFNEKTFDYSLSLLRPSIFVRGPYENDNIVPEKYTVEKFGIKVINPCEKKLASSSMLRKFIK